LPAPEFGGTVLSAGTYKTELIGRPDGQLQAFVTDRAGAKVDADASAKLKARVGADAAEQVEFRWDPGHACFVGKLEKGAKFEGRPLSVVLDAGGKSHVGGVAQLPLSVEVAPEAAVVVAGDFPVELRSKAGFVEARVFDASGKAQAGGDLDLKLSAGADLKANPALSLKWHAPCACYRAKLAAKLDLFAEPIKVRLFQNGRWHAGAAASLKLAQQARLNADAKLDTEARLAGDAKLDAKLPNPTAKLNANANANLGAAANAKAKAKADMDAAAKAAADAKAKAKAKAVANAKVTVPKPKVEVKKSASASTDNKGSAQAGFKGGFSLGTK
jgi:hypothetical protein